MTPINSSQVAAARERLGWSLEALAREAGVSLTTVWKIEAGRTRRPHRRVVRGLAAALGVSEQDLVSRPEPDTGSTGGEKSIRGSTNGASTPPAPARSKDA